MGKLSTARRVFKTHGTAGVITAFKEQYLDSLVGRQINWLGGKANKQETGPA